MMAKVSAIEYFALLLIISVISMRSELVAEGGVCEKVVLKEHCEFAYCKQVCQDLYKELFLAGECIFTPKLQCVCFYHCSPTTSNTPLPKIPN
ncbi:unnamed protein product [Sphenostylis stenocarpa]|uniref:Uncharacterized protein n=1 Tax=Sphenostylis stenocarpa TaxID=92480 RepID=A0AA86SU29_9FABA|nr:unnamed protein product [Sphenostylis stenocarpa]